MIEFFCTSCGTKIAAPDHHAHMEGRCFKCGKLIAPPNRQTTKQPNVLHQAKPAYEFVRSESQHYFDSKGRLLGPSEEVLVKSVAPLAPVGYALIAVKIFAGLIVIAWLSTVAWH
jgi:hypothetical protein